MAAPNTSNSAVLRPVKRKKRCVFSRYAFQASTSRLCRRLCPPILASLLFFFFVSCVFCSIFFFFFCDFWVLFWNGFGVWSGFFRWRRGSSFSTNLWVSASFNFFFFFYFLSLAVSASKARRTYGRMPVGVTAPCREPRCKFNSSTSEAVLEVNNYFSSFWSTAPEQPNWSTKALLLFTLVRSKFEFSHPFNFCSAGLAVIWCLSASPALSSCADAARRDLVPIVG